MHLFQIVQPDDFTPILAPLQQEDTPVSKPPSQPADTFLPAGQGGPSLINS
jgi:hypothetical protein